MHVGNFFIFIYLIFLYENCKTDIYYWKNWFHFLKHLKLIVIKKDSELNYYLCFILDKKKNFKKN